MVPLLRVMYIRQLQTHATSLGRDNSHDGLMLKQGLGALRQGSKGILGDRAKRKSCNHDPPEFHFSEDAHEPSGDPDSDARPILCTFRCLLKLETTEKWRPQPSVSQA